MREIKVRVYPEAKKEKVEEISPGRFKVYVKEAAQENEANKRVIIVLARKYGVSVKAIHIITGHRSPDKRITVDIN